MQENLNKESSEFKKSGLKIFFLSNHGRHFKILIPKMHSTYLKILFITFCYF